MFLLSLEGTFGVAGLNSKTGEIVEQKPEENIKFDW